MNLPRTHIGALQALGYTEDEARFLYLVATHSGYFLARQFLGFTGASWGKRTMLFWSKLQADRHARTYRFAKGGAAYHLFSRKVYREIGRENLRNRREHALNISGPALRCSTSCWGISISTTSKRSLTRSLIFVRNGSFRNTIFP